MELPSVGLRARLLMLVFLALIPAFGLIGYRAIQQHQHSVADANDNAVILMRLAAREQARLITSTRQLLKTLAQLPDVRGPTTAASCNQLLPTLHKSYPIYTNIGVATLDGNIFCNSRPLPRAINISDRSYFRGAVQSLDFSTGDYQIGRVTGAYAINFGYPVRDERGRIRSVVYAALDLGWLDELFATMKLPKGSILDVVDSRGIIMAHRPATEGWAGKSVIDTPLIKAIFASEAEDTAQMAGLDGVERLNAFTVLHENPAGKVYANVGIPADVAFAAAQQDFLRNILLLSVVTVLALIAAWVGSSVFILRRVNALDVAAQQLAKGNLSARTGLPHGDEEFGRLARSFDNLAVALQRTNRARQTLSAANRTTLRARDEETLLKEMCRVFVEVGGYRFAWIGYTGDDTRKIVRPITQYGFQGGLDAFARLFGNITWIDDDRGRSAVGAAIRTATPCVVRHVSGDPNFTPWHDELRRLGYASAVAFPLPVHDKIIGTLSIYSNELEGFDTDELELLTEAVQDLAAGIARLRTQVAHSRAQATIMNMARHDKLTGLPNHMHFEEQLHQSLREEGAYKKIFALLVIDVNRLRDINDALGFSQGDLLLKEVSIRISRVLSDQALVARLRGDEFGVWISIGSDEQAAAVANQILGALEIPFTIGDLELEVNAVIGISLFPQHGSDTVQLLRYADLAMQNAKKSGKNFLLYKSEFASNSNSTQRLAMAGELRRAIEVNDLVLHYQPKIDMRTARVCGVEALVRWSHPTRGLIPPFEFITLAERTGLIKPLTEWVVEEALCQSADWRKEGIVMPIAVNLSPNNLRDDSLAQKIEELFVKYKAEATWLELEITEGAVMEDPAGALAVLHRLSDMGIALSIDDFGTGYSSLNYLKKLPVDAMKIDRSFVADMLADIDSAAIVRSTISMAHELDLQVIAEGIERHAVWAQLAGLGCDVAQGYYISKPLPAAKFKEWFLARPWRSNERLQP